MANKDVFISYKSEELEEASWVKSILENNGISCWMAPACIPGGSSYAVEIPQAIKQAKVFVLILSSKAQSSQWISREVDRAINEGKVILPFMLENCALKDDFNFYLTNVQRYAAYENKVAAIQKMLQEIKALIGSKPEENFREKAIEKPEVKYAVAPVNVQQKYDTRSILSLIFGVIAMVMFGMFIIPNVVAVILSITSLKKIKMRNTAGKGLAISGQVLGVISTVLGLSILGEFIGFVIALVLSGISLAIFIKQYKNLNKT